MCYASRIELYEQSPYRQIKIKTALLTVKIDVGEEDKNGEDAEKKAPS